MRTSYTFGSYMGTYQIPCIIISESKRKYSIKYYDPILKENVEKSVDKDYVEIGDRRKK
jgi:hypothetical protein